MDRIRKNFKWVFLAIMILIAVVVWYAVLREDRRGFLFVDFLDVGQGDAIYIEAPNGNQILIDSGANKAILQELAKVMPFYDRSIDLVIATHPDLDHIGGFPEVFKRFKIGRFIESGVSCNTSVCEELDLVITRDGISRGLARRGMKINLDKNIYLLILFPDRDVSKVDSNDGSIVAKLVYGNNSFLLTGDSPQKIEQYLVSLDSKEIDADVLKVGHHGSKNSTSENFLGYVSPDYAVISAGKGNNYGHPHQEVLDLLKRFEIQILRTDELGAIRFKSDGETIGLAE